MGISREFRLEIVEDVLFSWIAEIESFIPFEKRETIWHYFWRTLNETQKDTSKVILTDVEKTVEGWLKEIEPYVPASKREKVWSHLWRFLKETNG